MNHLPPRMPPSIQKSRYSKPSVIQAPFIHTLDYLEWKDLDTLMEQSHILIMQSVGQVVSHIYTCIYIMHSVIRTIQLSEHFLK